jgi:hypothetical protein
MILAGDRGGASAKFAVVAETVGEGVDSVEDMPVCYERRNAGRTGLGWMRERQCVRCMQWLCCVFVVGKVWRIVPCVYKIYTLDRFQFHGLLRNISTRFSGRPGVCDLVLGFICPLALYISFCR